MLDYITGLELYWFQETHHLIWQEFKKHNRNVRRYMLTHLCIVGLWRRVAAVRCSALQSPGEFGACFWYETSLDLYRARLWFSQPHPVTRSTTHITVTLPHCPPSPFTSDNLSRPTQPPGSIPSFMSFTCFKKYRRLLIEMEFKSLLGTYRLPAPYNKLTWRFPCT